MFRFILKLMFIKRKIKTLTEIGRILVDFQVGFVNNKFCE